MVLPVQDLLLLTLAVGHAADHGHAAAEDQRQPSRTDEPFCIGGFEMKDKPNGGYGLYTTY